MKKFSFQMFTKRSFQTRHKTSLLCEGYMKYNTSIGYLSRYYGVHHNLAGILQSKDRIRAVAKGYGLGGRGVSEVKLLSDAR